jgi:predicted nucleic acid-binding protein
MPRVVISDSSPLRYLVLIGHADLLPALYSEVVIPQLVADELQQPGTPLAMRAWMADRPFWLRVLSGVTQPKAVLLADLDAGEREALLLALELSADLVLMDDREGTEEARRLGLAVTGTLGILDRGAERGLIDLAPAIARLRQTNFRISPVLLDRLLAIDALRKKR